MPTRQPLYHDFPVGEVKPFDGAVDTLEIFSTVYTKIIQYTATGSETNPFTVVGLDGLRILGVVRAGTYKRVTAGAVSDDETIKITGTELEDNKGIESSGGEVTLNSGDALVAGEKLDFIYYG